MFSDNDTHERKFPNKDVEWVGELPRSDGFYTLLASSSYKQISRTFSAVS